MPRMPRTQRWHVPMSGRDPAETHRASTPLELLFDLCFVVAVAQAAIVLHHDLAEAKVIEGLIGYLMVFFAIWWAWMNFTWFASAYDTDDVLYRLLTFVQIAGVLVIAAGIARAFESLDYTTVTIGYLVMRVGLVGQWLRAAAEHPEGHRTALRYAIGISMLQLGWLLRLALPMEAAAIAFVPLVALELAVPPWAERGSRMTPWHPDHIAERYGLFTIIVLGEVVLATSTAIQEAISAAGVSVALLVLALGALILVGAMWWAYFKHDPREDVDLHERTAFVWGYGHYVVFASVAAVGAGLQVVADRTHEETTFGPMAAVFAVAIHVVIYLLAAWLVSRPGRSARQVLPVLAGAVGVLVAAALVGGTSPSTAVLVIGLIVAGLVASALIRNARGVAE